MTHCPLSKKYHNNAHEKRFMNFVSPRATLSAPELSLLLSFTFSMMYLQLLVEATSSSVDVEYFVAVPQYRLAAIFMFPETV